MLKLIRKKQMQARVAELETQRELEKSKTALKLRMEELLARPPGAEQAA